MMKVLMMPCLKIIGLQLCAEKSHVFLNIVFFLVTGGGGGGGQMLSTKIKGVGQVQST